MRPCSSVFRVFQKRDAFWAELLPSQCAWKIPQSIRYSGMCISARLSFPGKLVFEIICHCETAAHTGRGNPPVERNQGTITAKNPEKSHASGNYSVHFRSNRGIATSHGFLAMTGLFERFKHQFVRQRRKTDKHFPVFSTSRENKISRPKPQKVVFGGRRQFAALPS